MFSFEIDYWTFEAISGKKEGRPVFFPYLVQASLISERKDVGKVKGVVAPYR